MPDALLVPNISPRCPRLGAVARISRVRKAHAEFRDLGRADIKPRICARVWARSNAGYENMAQTPFDLPSVPATRRAMFSWCLSQRRSVRNMNSRVVRGSLAKASRTGVAALAASAATEE